MAASTTFTANIATLLANGTTALTDAKCTAAAGPIQDVKGSLELVKLKNSEYITFLTNLKASMDAGDPNVTVINNMLLTLAG
jgi:hypothetical protein